MHQLTVRICVHLGVDALAGQEVRITRFLHRDTAGHLTNNQLDVLVVNRHALISVDLLDFLDEVSLRLADTLDVHELLGISWSFDDGITSGDLISVVDLEPSERRHGVDVFDAIIADDEDRATLAIVFSNSHDTTCCRECGFALWRTSFEELDHSRQTTSDVATTGNTTRVERSHGELRSRLADRLCSNDAHSLSWLDGDSRRKRRSIAVCGHTALGFIGERRQDTNAIDRGVVAHGDHHVL